MHIRPAPPPAQAQNWQQEKSVLPIPWTSEPRCPQVPLPTFSFLPFSIHIKGVKRDSPNPPVTAVRREIFPHPCNPHNKKGLSYLSDKTGIPWQRGIQKVRDVHCKRSQCLSANKTDLSVIFSNSVCTLHKLSHWICIIISRVQMRKQGLPMVPKPDNNGRTQQSPHLHRKQVSPLFQSLLYATSLSQDLHYYLFLLTERNLKTIFASSIQHLFCSELLQRQCTTPSGKSSTVRLLPWEPHSISASSRHGWELSPWASGLHLDLFCVYINRMCPNVFASSLYFILVYRSYHGKGSTFRWQEENLLLQNHCFIPC